MERPEIDPERIDLIRLSRAVVCVNCECVGAPRRDGRCAGCGSESVLSLARMVNREEAA